MSAATCSLTVLHTIGDARVTKQWSWNHHLQQWRKISYSAGAWLTPTKCQVADLAELVSVLDALQRDPRAFVVRGALTPVTAVAVAADPRHCIRRRKHAKNGVEPTLARCGAPGS